MAISMLITFSIAILLGVALLTYVLSNKNTPKGVAIIHGLVGAIGIILLVVYTCMHPDKPYFSLILLILAALGGFTLMFRDITNKSIPKWFALGHGFTALIGFIALIVFLWVTH